VLGKTGGAAPLPDAIAIDGQDNVALEPPDLARLLLEDPPYALVSERRQSLRWQGSIPITSNQLSEFLFRTLHEQGGRRPYPSGGACYPLKAYVGVHQCRRCAGPSTYSPTHELSG
jgi:hypothetical protein